MLEYRIADFDAEDTYRFEVAPDAAGVRVSAAFADGGGADERTFSVDAHEGTTTLAQGAYLGEASWAPPFLVPLAFREALARGEAELRTGLSPTPLSFVRADDDDEATPIVQAFGRPVLVGRGADGERVVVAASGAPQLVWLRAEDPCEVVWCGGYVDDALFGAKPKKGKAAARSAKAEADAKPAKAKVKAAKAAAKPAKPAKADPLRTGTLAKRRTAVRALAEKNDRETIDRLLEVLEFPEPELFQEALGALTRITTMARHRGEPGPELVPALLRLHEVPTPSAEQERATWALVQVLQGELDQPSVRVAFRRIAAERHDLAASIALSCLSYAGDPEASDRISRRLGVSAESTAAAYALFAMEPEEATRRIRDQLAAADDVTRPNIASTLLSQAERAPAGFFDVLSEVAAILPVYRRRFLEWVVSRRVPEALGRRDEAMALLILEDGYPGPGHDALLADFPQEAITDRVLEHVFRASLNGAGLHATLAAMPRERLVAEVAKLCADPEYLPGESVLDALLVHRADPEAARWIDECAQRAERFAGDDEVMLALVARLRGG
jgi:hypothetical protein